MRTSFHLKKKTAVILTAGVLTVGTAAGAFAYWSTTGSGTGSATNASSNGNVVLHATFAGGLTPGASEQVAFTGDNGGTSSLYVGTIHSVVTTSDPTCLAGDFTVADVVSNTALAPGASGTALGAGSITFHDSALNQDGCKGATVTLTLTSN